MGVEFLSSMPVNSNNALGDDTFWQASGICILAYVQICLPCCCVCFGTDARDRETSLLEVKLLFHEQAMLPGRASLRHKLGV